MKKVIKNHPKKSAAVVTVLAIIASILQFWGDIYPIVCPLVQKRELCLATGVIATTVGKTLDDNEGTIQLDATLPTVEVNGED